MHRLIALDRVAFLWVVAHRAPPLDPLFVALSYAGRGGLIWLAIALVAVIARRMSAEGGLVLAISLLIASLMTNQILKPVVARTRPYMIPPQIELLGDRPDDPSFPSGHSTNAFAGAYVLAACVPAARAFWWGLAVAIAFARIYIGVHYPFDVAAGAIVGASCAALVVAIARRLPGRLEL